MYICIYLHTHIVFLYNDDLELLFRSCGTYFFRATQPMRLGIEAQGEVSQVYGLVLKEVFMRQSYDPKSLSSSPEHYTSKLVSYFFGCQSCATDSGSNPRFASQLCEQPLKPNQEP